MMLPLRSRCLRSCAVLRRPLSMPARGASDRETPGLAIAVDARGVATVTLDAARRRNPLTRPLLERLRAFLRACAAVDASRPDAACVRAIVLESTGPVFCAGHDFADFSLARLRASGAAPSDGAARDLMRATLDACAEANTLLRAVPQVTVAAVAGRALGGGAQLAASCDVVLAHAERATFKLPGAADGGYCHTPAVAYGERLRARDAFALAALSDEVDAAEAARVGLANRLVAAHAWRATVDGVGARLAASFHANSAAGKRLFYEQLRAPTAESRYALATPVMLGMFASAEYQRNVDAFLDKK